MKKIKTYRVEATLKYPSNEGGGYTFEILAPNKTHAIKEARGMVWIEGHTRQDGPLIFTATEIED